MCGRHQFMMMWLLREVAGGIMKWTLSSGSEPAELMGQRDDGPKQTAKAAQEFLKTKVKAEKPTNKQE